MKILYLFRAFYYSGRYEEYMERKNGTYAASVDQGIFAAQRAKEEAAKKAAMAQAKANTPAPVQKGKLSYESTKERSRLERKVKKLEEQVTALEILLEEKKADLLRPEYASAYTKLEEISAEIEEKEMELLEAIKAHLEESKMARTFEVPDDEDMQAWFAGYNLLTAKSTIYAANVAEDDLVNDGIDNANVAAVRELAVSENSEVFVICAQIEQELAELDDEEKAMFLEELGLKESGLEKLIKAGFGVTSAINTVNTCLISKSGDECSVTLDLIAIDLFTGHIEFYKCGAQDTIVRKNKKELA